MMSNAVSIKNLKARKSGTQTQNQFPSLLNLKKILTEQILAIELGHFYHGAIFSKESEHSQNFSICSKHPYSNPYDPVTYMNEIKHNT